MKRSHLAIGLAALALLLLAIWFLFPKLFKPVVTQEPVSPSGEAAYNPLYALKLALLVHGERAAAWPNLAAAENSLGARDTLLLFDRPEAMTQAQAQRLIDWVRRGGHLLMPGPPGSVAPGPLAEALGLRAVLPPPESEKEGEEESDEETSSRFQCDRVRLPGVALKKDAGTWLCDPRFLARDAGFLLAGGDPQRGYRFARRALGAGSVTVAELRYLHNRQLREPEARALAFQLLAPGLGRGTLHLVYSADVPSLVRLLLTHAWMVLLPLALALAAWLAFRGQRFGPLQALPEPRRRALLEHVQASGEFAWSRHRGAALHAAVLRLFRQRLQRRAPEIDALSGESQVQALVAALSLPASRVRQALLPQGLQQPLPFTQSIATLLQMRSRL